MSLPEEIPLRYTEEDAGYMSVRPVVKQTFRRHELADMVVSVAGKDVERLQQIFRSGTVVYNGYRYWWDGFETTPGELAPVLALFPDDDPARPFDPAKTTAVVFESGGGTQRTRVDLLRADASEKRLFSSRSAWDVLTQTLDMNAVRYETYSHSRRADLYRVTLHYEEAQQLLRQMLEAAPRKLRYRWSTLKPPSTITFVNPRQA
jgi:hypothetical protein